MVQLQKSAARRLGGIRSSTGNGCKCLFINLQ